MTVTACISLGSNQGDAERNLAVALDSITAWKSIRAAKASPVYETEPQGLRDQPFFANQATLLECAADVNPESLLDLLQETESRMGRRRSGPRFGPRIIDLDLLLFGNARLQTPRLTLPHPRMLIRAFVLVPLADLCPDMLLPQGMTVREALLSLPHRVDGRMIWQSPDFISRSTLQ